MVTIRLAPRGKKGHITYRIVVSERRSKLVGKAIDDLGFYNATVKPPVVSVDREKLSHWQKQGALLSETVRKIIS